MIRIEFEVFGATAQEVRGNADRIAADFFRGPFRLECDARPFALTFGDKAPREWRASVVAEEVAA